MGQINREFLFFPSSPVGSLCFSFRFSPFPSSPRCIRALPLVGPFHFGNPQHSLDLHPRGSLLPDTHALDSITVRSKILSRIHFLFSCICTPMIHTCVSTATLMAQTQGTASSPVAKPPAPSNQKKTHNKQTNKTQTSSGIGGGVPFKTMELAPAPRRKKTKEKNNKIPEKISEMLPESALYTELLQLEAKVDEALARKKTKMQEAIEEPLSMRKTLRIVVWNTFANQQGEKGEGSSHEPPTWTLKIMGKIREEEEEEAKAVEEPKFSSFLKKITIYLDQTLYPENHVISWENLSSPVLHQGFEVKRKGDKEFTAIIRLEMNYIHERLKLSPALTEVLGLEVETRPRILTALWHYVKVKKLQDSNDPAMFNCDAPLRKVFGEEKVKFAVASQKLTQHLSPVPPIHLEHRIRLSGNNPSGNVCYDVLVDVPFPLEKDMSAFVERMENCREIDDYDNSIIGAINKINEHSRRRAFFLGFSQSPAEFINTLIASQDRDLKVVGGDAIQDAEKEQRSDFFNQPW